ncbi:MAG TPA: YDG domain-containing protein, partial [Chlorobaculum sp.]|nr:YDG domain-containing protein [Chlorobaculum sp.]
MSLSRRRKHQIRLIALCVCLASNGTAFGDQASPAPGALPTGGQVVSGQASISQQGTVLMIDQTTPKAAIDWSSFNIGSQAQVDFKQPDVNSVALNRVMLANPSVIEGKLTATGQVFLINPSGVIFGSGAQVDVGGLVASTMNISLKDFQDGTYRFTRDGSTAEIDNRGLISAKDGGYVALIGATVRNENTITANGGGTVALASGDAVSLEFSGGKLMNVAVDASTVESLIENKQLIRADGGRVLMTTAAASALQGAVINNTGSVEAGSISTEGGVIRLVGGTVKSSGTMSAAGGSIGIQADGNIILGGSIAAPSGSVKLQSAGSIVDTDESRVTARNIEVAGDYISLAGRMESAGGALSLAGGSAVLLSPTSRMGADGVTGGTVEITSPSGYVLASGVVSANGSMGAGGTVRLAGSGSTTLLGSTLDASGVTGGGQVSVGKTSGALASSSVFIDAASSIKANATVFGQGGSINLWSTNATSIYGTLSANGGLLAGAGGRIDISSAGVVNQAQGSSARWTVSGTPSGTIIEDPFDVVIGDAMTSFDVFKNLLTSTDYGVTTGQPITGLTNHSQFGNAVALNSTYALIGASSKHNGVYTYVGDAYLYNLSTGSWTDLATTVGWADLNIGSDSYFGYSVALNSTYALIGATRITESPLITGDAYLYNLSTGAWTDLAKTAGWSSLNVPNNAYFGNAVALNSTYALIGAYVQQGNRGDAYLYNLSTVGTSTNGWTDLAKTTGQPITGLSGTPQFGCAVALNSTYALVGAYNANSSNGNAYLYNLSAVGTSTNGWTDLATTGLTIPAGAQFGSAVALNSTYALIGAVSNNPGDAYLYNLSTGTWTDLATTTGWSSLGLSGTAQFGSSVALNSTYALIGAKGVSSNRGDAYLFDLSKVGTSTNGWTDLATTSGQPVTLLAGNSYFGNSVALNSTYALIGAPGVSYDRGDVLFYNLSGSWFDPATIGQPITGLPSSSYCGNAVALNSTYALIGAEFANDSFLYNLTTGEWTDLKRSFASQYGAAPGGYFGTSVALNDTYALIGASYAFSGKGDAYLYNLSSHAWTDLATMGISIPSSGMFGSSVALNSTYALIGAMGVSSTRGDAYLYNLSSHAWTDLATTGISIPAGAYFGTSVALNSTYALIGAPMVNSLTGDAYLYNLSSHTWTDLATTGISIPAGAYFGTSVALNSTYALIGAPYTLGGAVVSDAYLYNLSSGAWTDLVTTPGELIPSTSSFGYSVALNENYALIGAMYSYGSRGDAYLYNLSSGAWTDLRSTTGQPVSSLPSPSRFGIAVALNQDCALIGAEWKANGTVTFQGNAYLFNLSTVGTSTNGWTDLSTTDSVTASVTGTSRFGTSVALNSSYVLIGAPGATSTGDAYLYNRSTGNWLDFATTVAWSGLGVASGSQFGTSVALNSSYALIGAPGNAGGDAYLYNFSTWSWRDLATTGGQPVTGLASGSQFGTSVALNSSYALIGAPGAAGTGDAYLYNLSGGWTDLATTTGWSGLSVGPGAKFGSAVVLNDSYALIGAPSAATTGDAYLYNLSGGWTDLAATAGWSGLTIGSGANFGGAVALNNSSALIGANAATVGGSVTGDAYLYNLSGGWTDLAATTGWSSLGVGSGGLFGNGVALNSSYVLIGAPGVSGNRGDAYLYNQSTGIWADMANMTNQPVTGLGSGSQFGYSVAMSPTYALIGAPGVSSSLGNAWLVYLPRIVDNNGPVTFVTPETIAAALQTGNYTITADNDLSFQNPLALTPTLAGSGHTLTFQAGRSVTVNAPVDVSSYPTVFFANAPSAYLGSAGNRMAGSGGVTVVAGNSITDAGATLTLQVGTQAASGRDVTYGASGTISVASLLRAGAIIENAPDNSVVDSGGTMTSTGTTTVGGLTAGIFINAGNSVDLTGTTLTTTGSRWLIFDSLGTQPWNNLTMGSNTASFTRFGYSFGTGTSVGTVIPSSGNGLVYAVSPHLTVGGIGIAGKGYNGNANATITGTANMTGIPTSTKTGTLTSDVTGVTLNASGLSASFNNKNAGNNKPVTVSGAVLSDITLGYILDMPSGLTADITPATLNVTGSRLYNGTPTFGSGDLTLGGVLSGDTVNLSGSATVSSKNVGSYTSWTTSGLGLDNPNYTLTGGVVSAGITPASLTITAVSDTKVYDKTTLSSATPTVSGLQTGDTVSGLAESYDTANAGTGKTVSVTGYSVNDGNSGGNYSVHLVTNTTGVIDPRVVALSGNRTYDGTAGADASILTIDNNLDGANLSLTGSGVLASKNAGSESFSGAGTLSLGGSASGNYTLGGITGNGSAVTIGQASLTLTAVSDTKVYDKTTTASATPTVSGLQ